MSEGPTDQSKAPSSSDRPYAPYVAFITLKNFLLTLGKSGGVPVVIDNSVFGSMSGGYRSQLKATLRFLRFIDKASKPTDALHDAVAAVGDTAAWSAFVLALLKEHYPTIVAHPLTNTTMPTLRKEFEAVFGGQPDVITKAVSFFIHAAKESGVPLSPRLTERQKGSGTRRVGGRRRTATQPDVTPTNGLGGTGAPLVDPPPPPSKPRKVHEHQTALIEIINTYTDMDNDMRTALLNAVGFIAMKGVAV